MSYSREQQDLAALEMSDLYDNLISTRAATGLMSSASSSLAVRTARERGHNIDGKLGMHTGHYTSFAGVDIVAQMVLPDEAPMTIGELQTISYSIHRENHPVRTLGHTSPIAFVRSGRCIPAGEKVYIQGQGLVPIEKVQAGDLVQSSGSAFNRVSNVFNQGVKPVFELRLRNGHTLRASYDHPISTERGWVKMEDIEPEDKVHVVGFCPSPNTDYDIDDNVLKLIALLIGDGHMRQYPKKSGSIEHRIGLAIAKTEMDTVGYESEKMLNALGIPFRDDYSEGCVNRSISVCTNGNAKTDWRLREYNKLHEALLKFGLYGTLSHSKFIPQELIAGMSPRQVSLFLRYLLATDGYYTIGKHGKIAAEYSSTSSTLIDGLRVLLLKLGVRSTRRERKTAGMQGGRSNIVSRHNSHTLTITGLNLLRLYRKSGILGKDSKIEPYIPEIRSRIKNVYLDLKPKKFLKLAQSAILKNHSSLKEFRNHNIYNYNLPGISPRRALQLAGLINDRDFTIEVNRLIDELIDSYEDVYSEPVVAIDRLLDQPVYDLEVEGRHAFVCEGIIVHNTIAGSMIFTVFNNYAFYRLSRYQDALSSGLYPLADMLPPFDMVLTFANEYGIFSKMKILGLTFVDEGGTMSIDDLITESTLTYMARGIQPLTGFAADRPTDFF